MEKKALKNKVLLAVDGSAHAMEAVRYVATVLPAATTEVVLCHVVNELPELFDELDDNPLYRTKLTAIREWIADHRHDIYGFMDQARGLLEGAGLPPDAVTVKWLPRRLGVCQDLVREIYDGYSAVVVGRAGMSRIKDIMFKSAAVHLVGKVRHIPVIVVGGPPISKRVMIAFDGSHEALKGVSWVGSLLAGGDNDVITYSILSTTGHFWIGDKEIFLPRDVPDPLAAGRETIGAHLDAARDCLLAAGMNAERVTCRIIALERDRASTLVETAMGCGYGTLVVGRRGLIGFIEAVFGGRVSQKVLKMADDLTVWIV
jgi:nucleotide-binding universal stress UspA family protein